MPFTTAFDLVAEVGEEAQGIALVVGHARNETRDQDLAREHASVEFFHVVYSLRPSVLLPLQRQQASAQA